MQFGNYHFPLILLARHMLWAIHSNLFGEARVKGYPYVASQGYPCDVAVETTNQSEPFVAV
jgi:hypothetical protein